MILCECVIISQVLKKHKVVGFVFPKCFKYLNPLLLFFYMDSLLQFYAALVVNQEP